MESAIDVFAGFNISVNARRNDRGAWVADLDVSRDGKPLLAAWPETTQPEWRTPQEALRDGIERARRAIAQNFLKAADGHSWSGTRERAQSWFNGEMQHRSGVTFTRGS
jgi:hypothetical protein